MNITTKYNIDENDYLAFNLFYHSIFKKNNKKKNIIIWSIIFIFFILYAFKGNLLYEEDKIAVFLPIIIFFILYFFLKKMQKKNILKHIKKVYKPTFDEVTFTENTIEVKNETGNFIYNISQIIEINEIEKYYFLHLQTLGKAIIIPKEKIDNLSEIEQAIKDISQKYNIKHNVNLNWKY